MPDPYFVENVLAAVAAVPEGTVTSYGAIAAMVGGGGPRQVGRVLALHGDEVPWWRVCRADGTIAPGLVDRASRLLAAEGVVVRGGRILTRKGGLGLD